MKRLLKRVLKRSLRIVGPVDGPLPRILTYHSIGDRPHPMNVSPDAFEAQMRRLAANYSVISVGDAIKGHAGMAITFDDGYRDNLVNAAPILCALGLPATQFLVTQRMGAFLDHDRHDECARLMTWDDARAWRDRGLDLAGHTRTHRRLSRLDSAELEDQVAGCHADLERELGPAAYGFAYPFGSRLDYDNTAARAVEAAGFAYALSNRYGPIDASDGPWAVRRIWIDDTDEFATFQAKVDGRLDLLRALDSVAGIRLRRLVNRFVEPRTVSASQADA